jgi:hypothetical protein
MNATCHDAVKKPNEAPAVRHWAPLRVRRARHETRSRRATGGRPPDRRRTAMEIQFRRGPLGGTRHPVEREPTQDQVIYWVADGERISDEPGAPGFEGVVEYIYRGSGIAEYVGGLPEPSPR